MLEATLLECIYYPVLHLMGNRWYRDWFFWIYTGILLVILNHSQHEEDVEHAQV
jgi:hypothetical protein